MRAHRVRADLALAGRFRLLEWLWLGSARTRARSASAAPPRALELIRRAELAVELAARARRPAEPFVHGTGDALACELFRQAAVWALEAHRVVRAGNVPAPASPSPDAAPSWEQADPELLARAAGGAAALEKMRVGLWDRSFADFAELGAAEQADTAARAEAFVMELVQPLRSERLQVEWIRILRLVRVGSVILILTLLAVASQKALAWNEERRDIATGASWSPSSTYAGAGACQSPAQVCAEGPSYFFHTLQEDDPYIVFDLGRDRAFSRIVVENRLDCCTERAVPLVVEISKDREKWKEVTRRTEHFTTWRGGFPRSRARYVRLRVAGYGILHLSRVRLLP